MVYESDQYGANSFGTSQYGGGITVSESPSLTASQSNTVSISGISAESPTHTASDVQGASEIATVLEFSDGIVFNAHSVTSTGETTTTVSTANTGVALYFHSIDTGTVSDLGSVSATTSFVQGDLGVAGKPIETRGQLQSKSISSTSGIEVARVTNTSSSNTLDLVGGTQSEELSLNIGSASVMDIADVSPAIDTAKSQLNSSVDSTESAESNDAPLIAVQGSADSTELSIAQSTPTIAASLRNSVTEVSYLAESAGSGSNTSTPVVATVADMGLGTESGSIGNSVAVSPFSALATSTDSPAIGGDYQGHINTTIAGDSAFVGEDATIIESALYSITPRISLLERPSATAQHIASSTSTATADELAANSYKNAITAVESGNSQSTTLTTTLKPQVTPTHTASVGYDRPTLTESVLLSQSDNGILLEGGTVTTTSSGRASDVGITNTDISVDGKYSPSIDDSGYASSVTKTISNKIAVTTVDLGRAAGTATHSNDLLYRASDTADATVQRVGGISADINPYNTDTATALSSISTAGSAILRSLAEAGGVESVSTVGYTTHRLLDSGTGTGLSVATVPSRFTASGVAGSTDGGKSPVAPELDLLDSGSSVERGTKSFQLGPMVSAIGIGSEDSTTNTILETKTKPVGVSVDDVGGSVENTTTTGVYSMNAPANSAGVEYETVVTGAVKPVLAEAAGVQTERLVEIIRTSETMSATESGSSVESTSDVTSLKNRVDGHAAASHATSIGGTVSFSQDDHASGADSPSITNRKMYSVHGTGLSIADSSGLSATHDLDLLDSGSSVERGTKIAQLDPMVSPIGVGSEGSTTNTVLETETKPVGVSADDIGSSVEMPTIAGVYSMNAPANSDGVELATVVTGVVESVLDGAGGVQPERVIGIIRTSETMSATESGSSVESTSDVTSLKNRVDGHAAASHATSIGGSVSFSQDDHASGADSPSITNRKMYRAHETGLSVVDDGELFGTLGLDLLDSSSSVERGTKIAQLDPMVSPIGIGYENSITNTVLETKTKPVGVSVDDVGSSVETPTTTGVYSMNAPAGSAGVEDETVVTGEVESVLEGVAGVQTDRVIGIIHSSETMSATEFGSSVESTSDVTSLKNRFDDHAIASHATAIDGTVSFSEDDHASGASSPSITNRELYRAHGTGSSVDDPPVLYTNGVVDGTDLSISSESPQTYVQNESTLSPEFAGVVSNPSVEATVRIIQTEDEYGFATGSAQNSFPPDYTVLDRAAIREYTDTINVDGIPAVFETPLVSEFGDVTMLATVHGSSLIPGLRRTLDILGLEKDFIYNREIGARRDVEVGGATDGSIELGPTRSIEISSSDE